MTREEFIDKVKLIFCSDRQNNQFRHVCFDEFYTRILFNMSAEDDQFTDFVTDYKLLHRLSLLTNNKNIKVYYSRPYDDGNYCELIIDGFTIED